MGKVAEKVQYLINKDMLPRVMSAHKEDQKELHRLVKLIRSCGSTKQRLMRASTAQKGIYRRESKSHKQCRADEAVKFTTKKNCLTAQKNLFLIKKGKCAAFSTLANKVGTTKDNRAIVTKAGGESVESYIIRISTTICGKHDKGRKGNKKTTGGW